jgi:hypothetical protein
LAQRHPDHLFFLGRILAAPNDDKLCRHAD